jgi:hypothetical protein
LHAVAKYHGVKKIDGGAKNGGAVFAQVSSHTQKKALISLCLRQFFVYTVVKHNGAKIK